MYKKSDFNIDESKINTDLSKYVSFIEEYFSKQAKNILLRKYMTIEDYVYILYWLRFVEQLSYKDIARKLSGDRDRYRNFAYTKYLVLGWNYSLKFNEVEKHFDKRMELIRTEKENSLNIDLKKCNLSEKQWEIYEAKYKIYQETIVKKQFLKFVYRSIGYLDYEKFFNGSFYLTEVKNLSSYEIALIFRRSSKQAITILEALGLKYDIATAQKYAVEYNRRNYSNVASTGRRTMIKRLFSEGGSKIENSIRNDFSHYLASVLGTEKYEVIIGIENREIIPPKEVDIPIIIINAINKKTYKFAIEVNGDIFHSDKKKEISKRKELVEKNWKVFAIWQGGNKKIQVNYGDIEKQIREICLKIKFYLEGTW